LLVLTEERTGRVAAPRTIARLWQDAVDRNRAAPAYLVQHGDAWREVSWAEAATAVEELANGLLSLGLRKGDTVAILASTRLEWALFDFALASIGAIGAPIYPNSSTRDALYVIDHSDAVAILCEDEEQLAKVAEAQLEHALTFADLDDLRSRGREYSRANPNALAAATSDVTPDDLFTYIYTSGTTGPPKGCMIRHRDYYTMVAVVDELDDFIVSDDVMLLWLPLAHNFGRLMHLSGPYAGYTIAFCPDPYAVAGAFPVVRPTVFPSVPRLYEKIYTAITTAFEETHGPKRKLIDWALRVGRRVSRLRSEQRSVPLGLALQYRVADRLVYRTVKQRLGGRLRTGISGGAPLAREIAEFFHALDVLILEGYGLTECTSAATVNRPSQFRFGTVGPALPGVELRLADDGELLIRCGTIFAGYHKDEAATREILDEEGWLHSGDIAQIDEDGFVRITDRKKDLIVTAGGKNVAPQNLENALKTSPLVSQALVVGDRRPYVAALLTLEAGIDHEGAEQRIQALVDDVNRDLSRYEQIKRFAILPRDFAIEDGELTPTLKLKRRICEQHFAAEIDGLYA
jgi:long-chain acyl-CoA synthetase